ncbi:MAG TPA: enoyl-CoA hydratase/isomerase family protein [Saliniramus sp.]|nr:enoyl-CoA hydratase/isomerase family protein [Saliniramus sp.]
MSDNDDVLYSSDGGIARVTFNRPQARNALTFAMYERLADICAQVSADHGIRVMIIEGAGDKAFAAGTDIGQFKSVETAEDAIAYETRIDRVLTVLESCRVPTIAAVVGACTGGGAAIAACCDIRIAAANAKFGFPIARTLGNCLSISSLDRLVALIGPALTKEIIFTARLVEADEAKAAGLVSEVLPDPEALRARAQALAETIAANAPLTIEATKEGVARIVHKDREPGEGDDLILKCYLSEDFREGMEAFLAKRPPVWRGR